MKPPTYEQNLRHRLLSLQRATGLSFLPTSVLRLATDAHLANDAELRTTHRIDTPIKFCEYGLCDVRNTISELLTGSRRPNSVFTHLKLTEGKVLQKYYEVSRHVANLDCNRHRHCNPNANPNRNPNPNPNANKVSSHVGDAVVARKSISRGARLGKLKTASSSNRGDRS